MKKTEELLAAHLNGRQIGDGINSAEESWAKSSGLVVVFGASDDLIKFCGAIHDETGAYGGGTAWFDRHGLLPEREQIGDDETLKNFLKRQENAVSIHTDWCPNGENISWVFRTSIPHVTFLIKDGEDDYCRGIIFSINHLK